MDILIKNMDMPVDHGIFVVICPDGTIEQKVGNADNGYPIYNIVKDAKAVALPEHGDLKDETDIIHRIEKIADADLAQDIIGEILASPTIVEASR